MIGATLNHFRITAKLGEGGMGEVYRAEDTKLGREVAIKVLPEAFVADADRLARFEREARLLASLNHPRIAAVYEVGTAEIPTSSDAPERDPILESQPADTEAAVHYLVMELAEGETLDERLARGALPVEEALSIALQITEALEAAHGRGIVHRDLKPGNVTVSQEGEVKVLDFGLAKALGPEPTETASDLTHSPTLTYQPTRAGVLLGTAAYMSPEQARGKPADERSDLWALGVVLWEMLAGRRLFAGETVSDTLASVLKEEPSWSELPADTPSALRRLLRRCLRKDPKERLHHAADARLELREALSGESEARDEVSVERRTRSSIVPWTLVGLLSCLLAAAAGYFIFRSPSERVPHRLSIALDETTPVGSAAAGPSIALSPDGRHLAYVSGTQGEPPSLWLRELADFDARPISGTVGASVPFFSPDGEWIGFFADGKLKKVPVTGGTTRTICEAESPRGADWGDDGFIVFATLRVGGLLRVSEEGGSPEQITELEPERREISHRHPHVLPGGKSVLFTVLRETVIGPENRAVQLLRLESGKRRTLVEGGMQSRTIGSDHLVWARPEVEAFSYSVSGTLVGASWEPESGELTSRPTPLVEGVATVPHFGTAHYSVASDGSLVFLPARPDLFSLAWTTPGEQPQLLPLEPRAYSATPRLSPDGGRIALAIFQEEGTGIWVYDRTREALRRLAYGGGGGQPIWTPDGRFVTYTDPEGGFSWKGVDGASAEEQIWSPEDLPPFPIPESWSADGHLLAFTAKPLETSFDLWIADFSDIPGTEEAELRPLARSRAEELGAAFAPRGRWLAYTSDESGRPEIYVMDVETPEARRQVSSQGGAFPSWSPDGSELFYVSNGQTVFVVDVDLTGGLTLGGTRSVGTVPRPGVFGALDVHPTGTSFLTLVPEKESVAAEIRVVSGWGEEVRRLLDSD